MIEYLDVVGSREKIVVDADEAGRRPEIMPVACHALATAVACPVARQLARRWPVERWRIGLLLWRRWRRFGWRRGRRWLGRLDHLWRLDRFAHRHLVLE